MRNADLLADVGGHGFETVPAALSSDVRISPRGGTYQMAIGSPAGVVVAPGPLSTIGIERQGNDYLKNDARRATMPWTLHAASARS